MVAELLITTDMINSFKSCIGQKNYKPFFDKYKRTLCKDLDNIDIVLLRNETSCVIAQNISYFVRFLENFDPQYAGRNVKGFGLLLESAREQINKDIKDAILKKNWDSFYNEYIPYIDEIIDEARKQKILFVTLEHENNWYPNFSTRGNKNDILPKTDSDLERRNPLKTKNSGELLKFRPARSRELKTSKANLNGSHPTNSKVGNGTNNFSSFLKKLLPANYSPILKSGNMGNREETEVGTIDARTEQALNSSRPPTPDKQNSIQMVAELLISKDMITSFKSCIGQKNYKPFFDKYKKTLCKDLDTLFNVLLKNEKCTVIAQNMRKLIRHLENFNPQYPGNNGQGTYVAGSVREKITNDMEGAILGMNWDSFYENYIPYIDEIIDAAREQKGIFVCIEHESCWYPNFSSRLSSDVDANSETTSDEERDVNNSGENEARNITNLSGSDPDKCVESEDLNQKLETMRRKSEIQADLESYKNHVESQMENFEATKNDLKKRMEQKIGNLKSEIKCSLTKITDSNQDKLDELQHELQKKMDNLKLFLEEKMDGHVLVVKRVVDNILKELDSKIEKKVEEKFEELQNDFRVRKEESDRELEGRLEQLIAGAVEKRLEEKFEELRNEKIESERKIKERFEKVIGTLLKQKNSRMNSETSEVPNTSGGSVDSDQHSSGSSISMEIITEANGNEPADPQINEQDQDPDEAEQDHESNVSESSISVEDIPAAIENEQVGQEANDRDVDPDSANQEQQESSEESEKEKDLQQLLAEQNQFYEEKFRKLKERGIQKKQRAEEELRKLSQRVYGNAGGHQSVH
ncbi:unnamed protein product [Caenorhabditis nigoni]